MLQAVVHSLCALFGCAKDGALVNHAVLTAVAYCLLESVATVLSRHPAWLGLCCASFLLAGGLSGRLLR